MKTEELLRDFENTLKEINNYIEDISNKDDEYIKNEAAKLIKPVAIPSFLDSKGLTITDAQNISNKINILVENNLKRISPNIIKMSYLVDHKEYVKSHATPFPKYDEIEATLQISSKYRTLQAYLLIAIKTKTELTTTLEKEKYYNDMKEIDLNSMLLEPINKHLIKLNHIIEKFNQEISKTNIEYNTQEYDETKIEKYISDPDDLCKFLQYQTTCALIGNYIHKNGYIDRLQKNLNDFNGIKIIKESGENIVQINELPDESVMLSVEEAYNFLTEIHRIATKNKNRIIAKVKDELDEKKQKINEKTADMLDLKTKLQKQYADAQNAISTVTDNLLQKILTQYRNDFSKLQTSVRKLRIVIPSELNSLIESLTDKE